MSLEKFAMATSSAQAGLSDLPYQPGLNSSVLFFLPMSFLGGKAHKCALFRSPVAGSS